MPLLGLIGEVTTRWISEVEFSIEWKIPDFLSLDGKRDDYYASVVFHYRGERWQLLIFPKGFWPMGPPDDVSLFLCRLDYVSTLKLNITIGIRAKEDVQNKSGGWQEFSKEVAGRFWLKFCSRKQLKEEESRLMPSNALTIAVYIRGVEPSAKIDTSMQTAEIETDEIATAENSILEKRGMEELQKSLQELLAGGEDSDVLIKVQGKEFPAHRAILRARSPVLQAMFTHDMVEKKSGVVTMEDCDPESFPAFLEHIYTGSTGMISIENVFSLFTSADKYNLSTLEEACREFIKCNLTVSCFCDVITLAVKHNENELIECATDFFRSNTLQILKTVDWQIFLKENSTVGNELLIKSFSK